ncbi:MAG: LysM peptidoglycan-binding domain-containing protein [Verrucomicrobia bacterium]|nr:LysM peptidoglycan-binding domain-containing protein [Verrucomicrobiota bacterium]
MKGFAAALMSLAVLLAGPRAAAQVDPEDLRRLNGTVESLTEGQESLRRQVQELRQQLDKLRSENAQLQQEIASQKDLVTREQMNQVIEQVREVDRRRAADAEYVKTQLSEIAKEVSKSVAAAAAAKETPRPRGSGRSAETREPSGTGTPSAPPDIKLPEYMYEHVVKSGETVGAIIAAYNQEKGLKVTMAHVLAANPTLKDPKRLRVGQKLNIPEVK